ncbi:MAG TPA: glycine cleavage T C-terminal barrel domain-containing protein, partial [Actinomycetota bacterium]|nr:glycine cleavage T C-terminal barrel domain-containing protein [Actinomycetota bacterium]
PEQQYSPYELGFEPLVDLGKDAEFTGRRALRAERAAGGPARRLVGLELDWLGIEGMFAKHGQAPAISPFVHRAPVPVYKQGKQVGRATSITWGTVVKKMIGFGSVDRAHAAPGTRLNVEWTVEGERGTVAATVVPLPFLDLERKRT